MDIGPPTDSLSYPTTHQPPRHGPSGRKDRLTPLLPTEASLGYAHGNRLSNGDTRVTFGSSVRHVQRSRAVATTRLPFPFRNRVNRPVMHQSADLWAECLQYATASDVGLRRANNQDSFNVALASDQAAWQKRGHLFLVADGMGAHAAGELASKIAADVIPLTYHKLSSLSPPEALVNAIWDANKQIHARGQASEDFKGMGTTCSALSLLPLGALVAHVGDSRVYRIRQGRLEQITFDHSLVWEMNYNQAKLPAGAAELVGKNIITRSLGPNPVVRVDLEGPLPLLPGDTFVLCSDGLSGPVKDEEIGLTASCLPPQEAVAALINLANLRGGPDNITVIVVKVLGPQVCSEAGVAAPSAPAPVRHGRVAPWVWLWLGVALAAAALLAAIAQWLPAIIALGAAAAAGIVALAQYNAVSAGSIPYDGRPLGRGPYVAVDCGATADLLDRLAKIIDELRQTAISERWEMDFSRLDARVEEARRCIAKGDAQQAAAEYLRGICFLMDELKQQRRAGDSSIFGP